MGILLFLAAAPRAYALSYGLISGGPAWQYKSDFDAMERAGATTYRLMIRKSTYDKEGGFSGYDRSFRLAAEHGITVLPYFYGFGSEEQRYPVPTVYEKPVETGTWAWWVLGVVHRYGYNGEFWAENPSVPYHPVTTWEVWNEPNLAQNNPTVGGKEKVQPEAYASFLKYTGGLIRTAQSERGGGTPSVLFGGLSSWGNESTGNFMKVGNFLSQAHNVKSIEFNDLSLHPYWLEGNQLKKFKEIVEEEARKGLDKFGTSKAIWITELGWPVKPKAEGEYVEAWKQEELLNGSFDWVQEKATALKISVLIWFNYQDGAATSDWDAYCGLRELDGVLRPSWYAFQAQAGKPKWPTATWSTENLGGNTKEDPDIASWEPGRLDVFARGSTDSLMHKAYSHGEWSGWESLGHTLSSGPSAVSWGQFRVDVVAQDTDHSLLHWWYTPGTGWGSEDLGGYITSAPDIASWGPGRLDVFARGEGGELVHLAYGAEAWGQWEGLGGVLVGGPGAVAPSPYVVYVVARSTDNSIWIKWYDAVWSSWYSLNGTLASDPDLASGEPGQLNLFATGGGGELWQKWYVGSTNTWSEWQNLMGANASGPGAVSWNRERIDVVTRTSGNEITHRSWGAP